MASAPRPTSALRFGLRLQLGLAFGLLCALLALVLALTLGGMAYLRQEAQSAIAVEGAKSRAASEIAIATLLCRRYEKDIFLSVDTPATRLTNVDHWKLAYDELQQAIRQYSNLGSTADDRQRVSAWLEASGFYRNALLDVVRAIDDGRITTAKDADAALNPVKPQIRILTDIAEAQAKREYASFQQTNAVLSSTESFVLAMSGAVGLGALLIAIALSALLPIRFLRPIRDLHMATRRLAQGDLGARANHGRSDELGALAVSFNTMAEQIAEQMVKLDQSALVRQQNEQLRSLLDLVQDLEIPAIPLLDRIFLVPLVGQIDAQRLTLLQRRTLERVHEHGAHTVILDVTGLASADAAAVQGILQLATSVRLLGAELMMTGISANLAQTIAELDIPLGDITLAGRLQDGIAAVLSRQSLQRA
jgi:anti-anti-sigma regulatory factor/HAMP domain-containing protein